MIFGSVCSGIEAASVAWKPLGWKAAFFSEIEKFPSAVLDHLYPKVPNLGDMTKFKEWPDAIIDVLVGGTPCQSFSIAGLRKGLDDPRGNLMLTYLAIAARYRPKWLVWENVPGVLSSNGGKDFGTLLGGLGQLGYGFAYRVLDAQHFGVPQRRRRVFVVGHIGNWRRAAAVLFERHSLSGNIAPSRKKGEEITGTIGARTTAGGGFGGDFETTGGLQAVSSTTSSRAGHCMESRPMAEQAYASTGDTAHCLNAGGIGRQDYETETLITAPLTTRPYADNASQEMNLVTHSLRGEGFDASKDGTGRGTPLVPVAIPINTQIAMRHKAMGERTGLGVGDANDPAFTLQAGHSYAVAYRTAGDGAVYEEGDRVAPLTTGTDPNSNVVAFDMRGREGGSQLEGPHDTASIRAASGGSSRSYISSQMQVRRLTPRECERLQGFPDDYTLIHTNAAKKIEKDYFLYLIRSYPDMSMSEAMRLAKDGPRYKALGNSMAVPVMRWIGERITMVSQIA